MFKILLVIAALIVLAILFILIFKGKNLSGGGDVSMPNNNDQLNWDLWQKEQDEQNWANWQQQQDQQNWNNWDE